MLTLASSEGGLGQLEPVDLAAVTDEVLLVRSPEIGRLGLRTQAAIEPADFDGDRLLIERLVANLVDNAIRHNVAGGRVEIATRVRDGCAVLSVASTGPAIPAAEVGRLFQPFQRLYGRHAGHGDGHGLGLSIVRAIAAAHGAAIGARALPGGGLVVDITFRASRSRTAPAARVGPPAVAPATPATGTTRSSVPTVRLAGAASRALPAKLRGRRAVQAGSATDAEA
jgi:signal transduction histidine kinase